MSGVNGFVESKEIGVGYSCEKITVIALHPDARYYDINRRRFRTYTERSNKKHEVPREWLEAGGVQITALDRGGRYVEYDIRPIPQ